MATTAGKSQTLKYSLQSKSVLTAEEAELYELCRAAGVIMDFSVLKIIIDLLKLNVAPTAIMQMLRNLRKQKTGRMDKAEVPSSATRGRQSHTDRMNSRRQDYK